MLLPQREVQAGGWGCRDWGVGDGQWSPHYHPFLPTPGISEAGSMFQLDVHDTSWTLTVVDLPQTSSLDESLGERSPCDSQQRPTEQALARVARVDLICKKQQGTIVEMPRSPMGSTPSSKVFTVAFNLRFGTT
jgi:hypothetical protein